MPSRESNRLDSPTVRLADRVDPLAPSAPAPAQELPPPTKPARETNPIGAEMEARTTSPLMIDFRSGPVAKLTTNIEPRGEKMPTDIATARLEEIADLSHASVLLRDWMGLRYCWDAPAFCHQPLYFEEVNLERYGYGPRYARVFQPVLSGAHFFATVPALPYKMAVDPPWACVSTLGHYRPGSPAPYRVIYPPLSVRGALAEAAVVIGGIVLIP
jgi:hypothetical protein